MKNKKSVIAIVSCTIAIVLLCVLVIFMIKPFSKENDNKENESDKANSGTNNVVSSTSMNVADESGTTEKNGEESGKIEETTEEETTKSDYVPVQMAFVGDMNLSDKTEMYYKQSGVEGIFSEKILSVFRTSDITGINHEYVASDEDDRYKVDYELWYYKNPTYREKYLKEMGVDVVTLANNHTMDYGEQGLVDTMEALRKEGIAYVGVGYNLEEAKSAYIKEVGGKKIAVVAANRVVPRTDWYAGENKIGHMTTYEGTDRFGMIKEEISRLKNEEKCDAVVMLVHFGENNDSTLYAYQENCAHGYVDAGADLVVGCHTHTLQGAEIYNGKYIFYGVNNFLFENYPVDTVVVQATLAEDNSMQVKLLPCKSAQYQTRDVEGAEARNVFDTIISMSKNISIEDDGLVTIKE